MRRLSSPRQEQYGDKSSRRTALMVDLHGLFWVAVGMVTAMQVCDWFWVAFSWTRHKWKVWIAERTPTSVEVKTRCRIPAKVRVQLAYKQMYRCGICWKMLSETWELDHCLPLHLKGCDSPENMQIVHPNCHSWKTQHYDCVLSVPRGVR